MTPSLFGPNIRSAVGYIKRDQGLRTGLISCFIHIDIDPGVLELNPQKHHEYEGKCSLQPITTSSNPGANSDR